MSFRTEEKFYTDSDKYIDLKSYLILKNGKKQYTKRLISSIYFDNHKFQSFTDSQEGSVMRKKIRIRNYPKSLDVGNKNLLECKISSVEGRYKTSCKLSEREYNKVLNYGFFDTLYGICMPIVVVNYYREYFVFKNGLRATLDRNIEYHKYKEPIKKIRNNQIVLEIKNASQVCSNIIINQFPFIKNRFSKFALAVQAIYNKAY